MPISSLPDSTLRAITSTLVLHDAVSVVKELVDNALDAKATTIAIEISANTLDVVSVKDNGFGIGVEDRQLVCKRGCTSKITTIQDLERLGGSSFGFRGEALASVADLSESVTLTTRVDGEMAGSSLKYGPAGALLSSSSWKYHSSQRFLKTIPVRRQTALKNAPKTLSAIKTLLQGYAFARGTVRISLKVLKGENEKANWSYNPVDSAEKLRDVAARIVGKDVAGGCEIRTKNEHTAGEKGEINSAVALLAIIDTDMAKLNNTGHYISIDGRPVTAARGTIKKVVKSYRHYIRNSPAIIQDLPTAFDPLLVMHISCPRGSYDVNIEPAKDEVMFINPESILGLVKSLFEDYYGEPGSSSATDPSHDVSRTPQADSAFSLLLAERKQPSVQSKFEPATPLQDIMPCAPSPQPDEKAALVPNDHSYANSETLSLPANDSRNHSELSGDDKSADSHPPRGHPNMYGFDEGDELPAPSLSPREIEQHAEEHGDFVARNPWSLAKLNAPVRRPSEPNEYSPLPTRRSISSSSPQLEEGSLNTTPRAGAHCQPLGVRPQLLSPATSPRSPDIFQNPGPPQRPWPPRQRRNDVLELESRPGIPTTPSTGDHHGITNSLDSWAKPIVPQNELPSFKRVSELYDKGGRLENADRGDSLEPSHVQTSLNSASHGHPQRGAPFGRPFKSPLLKSPAGVATDTDEVSPKFSGAGSFRQLAFIKLSQSQNPELDQIMEFEHRKKAANAQQRKAFGKAKARGMSIAELARLQRSSMQAEDGGLGSTSTAERLEDSNRSDCQASTVASFSDRFDNPTDDLGTTSKPSPHRNRYLAAVTHLQKSRPDVSGSETNASDTPGRAEVMDNGHETPKIPEDDARACLIRHHSQTSNADAGGLSRTGLKIRRTKRQRLPLEAIPPDMMLHELIMEVNFDVRSHAETSPGVDKYGMTGKNDFVSWSSSMADVSTWQERLVALIDSEYRARVRDELISPNVGIDLRKMIRTHCDNI